LGAGDSQYDLVDPVCRAWGGNKLRATRITLAIDLTEFPGPTLEVTRKLAENAPTPPNRRNEAKIYRQFNRLATGALMRQAHIALS
jgi:hypothetical protein